MEAILSVMGRKKGPMASGPRPVRAGVKGSKVSNGGDRRERFRARQRIPPQRAVTVGSGFRARQRIPPQRAVTVGSGLERSKPETWVTLLSGDMGNS